MHKPTTPTGGKPGRNDPCPCGSGRKYKHCCSARDVQTGALPDAEAGAATDAATAAATDAATAATAPAVAPAPQTGAAIPALLKTSLAHHQAGRLAQAEAGYRQILEQEPHHTDALHLLGIVAEQCQQPALAVQLIEQAVSHQPAQAEYAASLARLYMAMGRLPDAVTQYERVLALGSAQAGLYNDYGIALHKLGQLQSAIAQYRQALTLQPDMPGAHFNLAAALDASGDIGAEAHYRRVLELDPQHAVACNSLGCWLAAHGQLDDAVASFQQALTLQPDFFDAHNNLGFVLRELKRYDQAARHLQRAVVLNPASALAHNNLGTVLYEQGQRDAAIEHYCQALRVAPDYADAYNNLGLALTGDGVIEQGLGHLLDTIEAAARGAGMRAESAMTANPNSVSLSQALVPTDPKPASEMMATAPSRSRFHAALSCFRRALVLDPNHAHAHSNLLFHLNYAGEVSPAAYLQEAIAYGTWASSRARPYTHWPAASWQAGQRLRIGFVSGDLRNHPVGFFLESVIAHLDPQRFELVAYATQPGEDSMTARLRRHFAQWHKVSALDDAALARYIHQGDVHILVDLAGHTAGNRLPVFAYKPAPVQVAWLGYFASTGLKQIDYIVADPIVLPETEAGHFVEQPWRLPDCYLCFTPPPETIAIDSLPMLRNGYPTFGCFNKLNKMNDGVVAVWARILTTLPTARLVLKARELNDPALRAATQAHFAQHGIDPARLDLAGYTPRADYLSEYGRIDIALDPFPYPGGTTTVEALWMGVPVLSLRGDRFLSHAGESLLSVAGLRAWVARDEDDYVAKASSYAQDAAALSALRANLRVQLLSSPLCDGPSFAVELGAAFEGMWRERMERGGVGGAHVGAGVADE